MDSAIHAAAAEQSSVGSVDDGIDIQRGDVGNTDLEPGRSGRGREKRSAHDWMLAKAAGLRSVRVVCTIKSAQSTAALPEWQDRSCCGGRYPKNGRQGNVASHADRAYAASRNI